MPASFPRVRSEETGIGSARPRTPRLGAGAQRHGSGVSRRRFAEAGMRKAGPARFRPRINPRGRRRPRSVRASTHFSHSTTQIQHRRFSAKNWSEARSDRKGRASREVKQAPLIHACSGPLPAAPIASQKLGR